MYRKRICVAAFLVCWLCLLAAASAAQAPYDCSVLEGIGYNILIEEERLWYDDNCLDFRKGDETYVGGKEDEEEESYRPPDVTCPHLPARVVVTGYAENSQCQMVGEVVISGHPELQSRGFVDAVDVWSYVNGGLEVCFRNTGWLVFLDAAYSPRLLVELAQYQRDGMTCGEIDRAGTVVLLREGPPSAAAPIADAPATLPVFDAIPLHDCQIKLVETLFLRATPAGEIIGLVWLNTEVQAFEINGFWYKIEFEGKTGYISRYYRRVLRGGCG